MQLPQIPAANELAPGLVGLGLICAIVYSALAVVCMAQDSRHLFTALEDLQHTEHELEAQWSRLMLEHGTLLSQNNVEVVVSERLSMSQPVPGDIVVVRQ